MSVSPPPQHNSEKVTWANACGDDRKLQVSSWCRSSPWLMGVHRVARSLLINSSLSWREPVWMKPSKSFLCISADQWGGGGIKDGKTENAGNRNGFIIPLMAFIMRETRIISNPLYSLVFVIWAEAGAPETALTKVCGALTRWGRWWFDDG